ncbi:MAG TPA: HlyD family efflux transporter periplasmic adaptor subunit [Vicinamibacterales bacterium]|nr:HlyD family efflux transporter periplasmic adaptor subunit [Vicinamibacterales bacterium]
MDVARPPEVAEQRKRRRIMIGAAVLLLVVATTVALARLKPAAPTVEGGTLWIDSVKRGTMLRQVRGNGVLVPDEIRWITALTDGRVERVLVQPGTAVTADTVLLELSNPQTEQAALTADLDLRTALAQYEVLKADLARDLLAQRVAAATVDADAAQAAMDAAADEAMAKNGFISAIQLQRTKLRAETAAARKKMEAERLANTEKTLAVRLDVQQAEVDRRKTMSALRRSEATGLRIRAGVSGVLQEVPVEVGQRIGPGTNLARVVDPTRLKAQLQIAETQVKDIVIGQKAEIDTRNGVTKGRVVRIDPAARNGTVTVDVVLEDALPRGARPDMSVDGTIELERLDNILYVGRPAFGQEQAKVSLFKLSPDRSTATLTQVELGRSSVNTIELIRGLSIGDCVVLSDMSAWDGYDRLRISGSPPCGAPQ